MPDTRELGYDPIQRYAHLEGDGTGFAFDFTAEFWPDLMSPAPTLPGAQRLNSRTGWLMLACALEEDGGHWEMHPNGDEFLFLLSGGIDILLEEEDGVRTVALEPRRCCFVPRGTWHRFVLREPGELLALTYGQGTQMRPLE